MKFFWNNLVDAGATALTASSENASYPVANLIDPHLQKLWKTGTSAAEEYITLDLGSALEISSIILAGHDFTTDDDLRFMVSDASDFADADEMPIEWSEDTILCLFPTVSARYVRVMFTKASSGETRQLARLFVGPHSEQDELPDEKGFKVDPKDLSKVATSIGGQDWGETRPRYREFRISGTKLTEDDALDLVAMDDHCGIVTPFFMQVQDPVGDLNEQPITEIIYCRLKSLTGREHDSSETTLRWKVTLDLKEYI